MMHDMMHITNHTCLFTSPHSAHEGNYNASIGACSVLFELTNCDKYQHFIHVCVNIVCIHVDS